MDKELQIIHRKIELSQTFEAFKTNLESLVNQLPLDWHKKLTEKPQEVRELLIELAGETGLMIFGKQEHGLLLKLANKNLNAIQYIIGNPLVALSMTQYDIRVALYVPLRILLYENSEGKSIIEYDLPSSLLQQFDVKVLSTALELDKKILNLIQLADRYEHNKH